MPAGERVAATPLNAALVITRSCSCSLEAGLIRGPFGRAPRHRGGTADVRALRFGCESMVADAVGRGEPFRRSIGPYQQSACCHSPTQPLSPVGRDETNACVVNVVERDH